MATTTRDRTDELQALEELWEAPAHGEIAAPSRRLPLVPGALVVAGWTAYLFVVSFFAPTSEPGTEIVAWAKALLYVQLILLFGAAGVGRLFDKLGFAAVTGAGALGLVLAVECRASAHHLGNWWLFGFGASLALTALAAVGLAQRLRR